MNDDVISTTDKQGGLGTFLSNKWRGLAVRWLRLRHLLPAVHWPALVQPPPGVLPPIMDHICMPPHLMDAGHDDYTPLMSIARHFQPETIVELGTAHGNTTANLCAHCPSAHVFTVNAPVDIMTGSAVTYALRPEQIGSVYRNHGFSGRVTQIYENTLHLDLATHLRGRTIDLAIIDACHDTAYVINDFHKVRPHMSARGIILLHDTHPSMEEHLWASYIACMKLRRAGHDIRHLEHTWWAVWFNEWPPSTHAS